MCFDRCIYARCNRYQNKGTEPSLIRLTQERVPIR